MMKTLFVSFSCQSDNSELEYFPRPIGKRRSGLGFILSDSATSGFASMLCGVNSFSSFFQYFLSTVSLLSVEKHARNELKDTKVPTVSAIRTGQDRNMADVGPDRDGWEIQKQLFITYTSNLFVACLG